jgi:predicted Zn-dependent protease
MLGRSAARQLLEAVVRRSRAEQTEAVLVYERQGMTRFAGNAIHQNMAEERPILTVRAVHGRQVGTAVTTNLDDASLTRIVAQAEAIARRSPVNAEFPGLPGPAGDPGEAPYSAETLVCDPGTRGALAAVVCRLAREAGLGASGSVQTVGREIAVANSLGVFAYSPWTHARLVVAAIGEDGSGAATENASSVGALDAEGVARRAIAIGQQAQHPIEVPPGEYTVILQPEAVADMIAWLSLIGFGAAPVQQGWSFVAGKRGELVLGENVSLWDDGHDPTGLPLPFDYEGMPRQRLSLIERGVAGDVALDSAYAARMGTRTNGHASPLSDEFELGPIPTNVFMAPGTSSVDEMIRSTERGLLVTRFHYTIVVHPRQAIVTGMTRDGTFLIEHGEVTSPVKNLRYTQSYVEALREVEAIGAETPLAGRPLTIPLFPPRVPALKIGRFTFTGVTQ